MTDYKIDKKEKLYNINIKTDDATLAHDVALVLAQHTAPVRYDTAKNTTDDDKKRKISYADIDGTYPAD